MAQDVPGRTALDLVTLLNSHRLADRRRHVCLNVHAVGAQVVGEVFGGYVQRVQQVRRGRHIWLPPPACNRPDPSLQATIQPGHKAIPRENRQHIIAPAALWFGLLDLPDVIKIEKLHHAALVPQNEL